MSWLEWLGVAVVIFLAGALTGYSHEKHAFDVYRVEVSATAEAQQRETQKTIQKHEKIAQETKSDYESRIAAIRRAYRVPNNGAGLMPTAAQASCGSNAGPSYAILAESCAETTQQLVSLQDFIKETQ